MFAEKLPSLLKSAASLGSSYVGKRSFSTEAVEGAKTGAKAVSSAASPSSSANSAVPKEATSDKSKKGGRRGRRNERTGGSVGKRNNAGAAVAVDSQDNGTKEADGVKRVTTRLVDNHPITEADRNPRYFLSHLTEDKLDPNVPVFKEDRLEFPDNYSDCLLYTSPSPRDCS